MKLNEIKIAINTWSSREISITTKPSKINLQTVQEKFRANLTRLSPQALQIPYKVYVQSLAVMILYYRDTCLHDA